MTVPTVPPTAPRMVSARATKMRAPNPASIQHAPQMMIALRHQISIPFSMGKVAALYINIPVRKITPVGTGILLTFVISSTLKHASWRKELLGLIAS